MRRLVAWIAGILSIAALVRWFRRHRAGSTDAPVVVAPVAAEPAAATDTAAETEDPAEELREKLAASRADEPAPADVADTEAATDTEEPPSLDERRARVHERAQEAIDAMRDPPEGA